MKTILICSILAFVLLLAGGSHVMADAFMCGSEIINIGDRGYDVLRKCGEPSYVDTREEVRIRRGDSLFLWEPERRNNFGTLLVKELVTVEEWEYNLGPTRFIRYLTFENGRLRRIATGDYGY